MPRKRLLRPERLRHVPAQFSWIDQRLVREGYLERCPVPALALYLLLVTVADAQGQSYYGDATVCRLLSLSSAQLDQAHAQRRASEARESTLLDALRALGAEPRVSTER